MESVGSVESAAVKSRLQAKLQRALARAESSRLAAEAAALEDEAELQRLVVDASHRVAEYSGDATLRDSLEFSASLHTRASAMRALAAAQRALSPGAPCAEAAAALSATAAAPAVEHEDPEVTRAAARAARLSRLMQPTGPLLHPNPWSSAHADPERLGTARVPSGMGSPDYSKIPVTHREGDCNAMGRPWMPSNRSSEATLLPHKKSLGATGTWPGHGALDAPALASATRGLVSGLGATQRSSGGSSTGAAGEGAGAASSVHNVTTGTLLRFAHDPIPSHIVPSQAYTKAGSGVREPLPRALLNTLTREQLRAPRHPAYLLDSHVHHAAPWKRPPKPRASGSAGLSLFSQPPASAPPTLNDLKRAALAMVPERSLPSSDPVHAGKAAYTSSVHPPRLFSVVPLDYVWEAERAEEEGALREAVFWRAASEMEGRGGARAAAGRGGRQGVQVEGGEGGEGGGDSAAATGRGPAAAGHLPAHLTGPLASPMRLGSGEAGQTANFRTFSASGMWERGQQHLQLGSTLSGSSRGLPQQQQPALALLRGPLGAFQPVRAALVFDSEAQVAEYEAARKSLAERKALGAKALEVAQREVLATIRATEARLVSRGVGTGLGTTGSGLGTARGRKMVEERLKRSLEP